MSNGGDCRTAPATQSLLITYKNINEVESVIICSFIFSNQNVAQATEQFAGMCVMRPPLPKLWEGGST